MSQLRIVCPRCEGATMMDIPRIAELEDLLGSATEQLSALQKDYDRLRELLERGTSALNYIAESLAYSAPETWASHLRRLREVVAGLATALEKPVDALTNEAEKLGLYPEKKP